MKRIPLLTAATLTLMALPLAMGHVPAGTPDTACTGITALHDYGAPISVAEVDDKEIYAVPTWSYQDGNLEDCGYTAFFDAPEICALDPTLHTLCYADHKADYDGELEYGVGGALLAAADASIFCWNIQPHHPEFPSVSVQDTTLGGSADVFVTADWPRDAVAPQFPCGDGIIETCDPADPIDIDQVTCNALDGSAFCPAQPVGIAINTCTGIFFGPGSDGAYHVFIGLGTQGHIWTPGAAPFDPVVNALGCSLAYEGASFGNAWDYPSNVLDSGPFSATDKLVVAQAADTLEWADCAT